MQKTRSSSKAVVNGRDLQDHTSPATFCCPTREGLTGFDAATGISETYGIQEAVEAA